MSSLAFSGKSPMPHSAVDVFGKKIANPKANLPGQLHDAQVLEGSVNESKRRDVFAFHFAVHCHAIPAITFCPLLAITFLQHEFITIDVTRRAAVHSFHYQIEFPKLTTCCKKIFFRKNEAAFAYASSKYPARVVWSILECSKHLRTLCCKG